jgi:hypothetical protein
MPDFGAGSLRELAQLWSNDSMCRALLLVLLMLGGAAKGQSVTMFADPIGLLYAQPHGSTAEHPEPAIDP